MTGSRHALVVTGGPHPDDVLETLATGLPETDLVVAADGGAAVAHRLGLVVDVLVGDLDSADDRTVAEAREVQCHPVDKDYTDLELALATALDAGMTSATIVATMAGRVDHALGNLLVVAADRWSDLRLDFQVDGNPGWVVRDVCRIDGRIGDLVSLLAVGGPATGITTSGLAWELDDAALVPGVGLGLSNRMTAEMAEVRVASGVVLALRGEPD